MIIALSGYAGSGKDEVAKIIQELTSGHAYEMVGDKLKETHYIGSIWEIKKFSYKLKLIASILTGIPVEKFEDQEFKNTLLGPEWNIFFNVGWKREEIPMTVREFLQRLGTEGIRDGLHSNAWVNALMVDYKACDAEGKDWRCLNCFSEKKECTTSNWIITDCRFHNEAAAVQKRGGIIVRVDRGLKPVNNHPSEVDLDKWPFDYTITNYGTKEQLRHQVINFLDQIGIKTNEGSSQTVSGKGIGIPNWSPNGTDAS